MATRMAAVAAVALVAVMGVLAPRAAAQTPNCAAKLVPCSPYMNTTGTPPDTCAAKLVFKDAVQKDLKCLCDLYASPEIFKAFKVSLDNEEALGLSKRYGSPARSDGRGVARLNRDNAYRPGSSASRLSDPLPAAAAERAPAPTAKEHARRAAPGAALVPAGNTPDADADAAAQQASAATPATPPRREDELVDGWPTWLLDNVPREALQGLVPKSAAAYDMIEKVGEGSYSEVYRARERGTGRIVALKKLRSDTSVPESVRFMPREIQFLQRLDHPNVMKLEGIATSRSRSQTHRSIYLVFDFMYSDLGRIVFRSGQCLTEPQIKSYMQQLLEGLQHCHERGILHLDIKPSNLMIDRHGVLKIGDFGLAHYRRQPVTARVVSLSYRAPELLLGSASYGVGTDLWSAGCVLAEMFLGKPLMLGGGEKDQLLKMFELFGSPPDDYWRKMNLSSSSKPPEPYKSTTAERFRDLPPPLLGLLATLFALDPAARGTAGQALQSSFFSTPPLPCDLSPLPVVYREEEVDARKPRGLPVQNIRVKPGVLVNLFQVEDGWTDDGSTDTANSGQEPVIKTGNPGQETSAANASSSAHDGSSEETIASASSSTVAKRFSDSPVVQEASPVQNQVVGQDQEQLPTANTSHHSGSARSRLRTTMTATTAWRRRRRSKASRRPAAAP